MAYNQKKCEKEVIIVENDNKVRELQLREIDILKTVVNIMDKIGVKYYLSAGSLLGAVRHKGFIPWDDDIDIMLPRKDFERFLLVAKDYLPEYYRVLHYSEEYEDDIRAEMERQVVNCVLVIQILDTRYTVTRKLWSSIHKQNIWIDIAALDEIPDNKIQELWYHFRLKFLHVLLKIHRLEYKAQGHKSKAKIADWALSINNKIHFARLIKPIKVIKRMDDILKANDGKGYKRYINFMGEYKFKEVVPLGFLGKETYTDFEGMKMRIPEDYDIYLKAIYGDYMQLPPEEKRVCKHIVSIDQQERGI